MNSIVADMRPLAASMGILETRENIRFLFYSRVRANLHLVLMFSPIGASFRSNCRMFPSLINCCTIDWYDSWPEEALRSVADSILINVDLGQPTEEASALKMEALSAVCAQAHLSVRDNYIARFWDEQRR
eukprot:5571251-Prymnesium_polylepis.1